MINEVERARRLRMVTGVFIQDHAVKRGHERSGMAGFAVEAVERDLVKGNGRFFFDKKHENYRFYRESKNQTFCFDLKVHDDRPGLLAYVKTVIPGDKWTDRYRFEKVDLQSFEVCSSVRPVLDMAEQKLALGGGES